MLRNTGTVILFSRENEIVSTNLYTLCIVLCAERKSNCESGSILLISK